jgi:hypothetical protein
LWLHPTHEGHDFNNLNFVLCQKSLIWNLAFLALWFFRKRFWKNSFPFCGPTRPPESMILTNVILYYVRKLSCKFGVFWFVVLVKRSSNDPTQFYILVIIYPFKRIWPFKWINLNSLYLILICSKFDWMDWLVLYKSIFNIKVFFYFVAIISPRRRVFLFIWTNFNPLLPRMIYALSGWNRPLRSLEDCLFGIFF